MRRFIRNYPFSVVFAVFIWVICLIPIPETPLSDVRLIDKWTHIALYFVFSCIVGHEYFRTNKKATPRQLVLPEWLIPIIMGGLIEIVQATCTNGVRSGDWLDWLGDAIGSTIALLLGIAMVKIRARHS